MKLEWDHIIHYIDGLENFEFPDRRLNLIEGGRHEQLGTYNRLSYFGLSYIEFIDSFDRDLITQAVHSESQHLSFAATLARTGYTEGFKRLCFRTDDIQALRDHFISCGLKVMGPARMSRRRPDGEVIEWQLLYIDEASDRELPFFIQWGSSDRMRTEELKHHFQPYKVKEILMTVSDKERVMMEWQDWFGAERIENTLKIGSGPLFSIKAGEKDKIEAVTIKAQSEQTLTVHGADYIFYA